MVTALVRSYDYESSFVVEGERVVLRIIGIDKSNNRMSLIVVQIIYLN